MADSKFTIAASTRLRKVAGPKSQRMAVNDPLKPSPPAKRRQPAAHGHRRIAAAVRVKRRNETPDLHIDRNNLLDQGFIDPEGNRSKLTEELRLIKRPLLARAFKPEASLRDRVILVTSSRPGEGKTFSAVNLAISLGRERDANILLIDSDQVVAGTSAALGLPRDPGLADLLSGSTIDPGQILRKTDIDGLWFIPPGLSRHDLTELLASTRMTAILDAILSADPKRIIVIDAPPLLATSEAMVLTMHAGQTVFVIEAGGTPRVNVEEALSMVAERSEVQLILNKAQSRQSRAAYYSPYYDAYGEDLDARRGFWRQIARMMTGRSLSIGVVVAAGLAAAPIAVAKISIVPRINAALGYTDNVDYSNDGNGDLAAEVAPGVEISIRTARILAIADYAIRQTLFLDHADNDLQQNLQAQLRGEIINDALYLDLTGDFDQAQIDSRGQGARPIFGASGNQAQRITSSVSPFFRREIGGLGDLEMRYGYTRSTFNDNDVADADSHSFGTVFRAAPTSGPFTWTAQAVYDDSHFDGTKSESSFGVQSGIASVEGRYNLNPSWALLGGLGYSILDDDTLDDHGDDSVYWRAGFDYQPNSIFGLRATAGQTFAKPAIDLEATARLSANLQLSATYSDGLQSRFRLLQDQLQSRDLLRRERPNARAETLEQLNTLVPEADVEQVDDNTFRQRRGVFELNAIRGRNAFQVNAFIEDRDFDLGTDDRILLGANGAWTRQLTRNSSLTLGGGWSRTTFDSDNTQDDEYTIRTNYAYDINATTAIDVGHDFFRRLSDEEDEDVLGNTIFIRLRKRF